MLQAPLPMHIPDGFLSTIVSAILWILSIIVIAIAFRRVSKELGEREVPVMGVLAAAIFAGQMLNFTVAGGTSGHLMGAALATILLGPWASIIILTCVVGVQALIFQDGGLLALGANIFNMGIVGTSVAVRGRSASIRRLSGGRKWGIAAGSFIAAWCSIFVAALAVALQLAISGTSPANLSIPAMAGIHALIGIGEGLITMGAVSLILAARPDLLESRADAHQRFGRRVGGGRAARPHPGGAVAAGLQPPGRIGVGRRTGRFPGYGARPRVQHHPRLRSPRRLRHSRRDHSGGHHRCRDCAWSWLWPSPIPGKRKSA